MVHKPHPDAHTPELHEAPDAWHLHTASEERPQAAHGEVANPRLVMFVGLVSFLAVVLTCVIVYGYYMWYTVNEVEVAERYPFEADVVRVRTESLAALERGYVWTDHEHVQLPLALGKRAVVARYAQGGRAGPAPAGGPVNPSHPGPPGQPDRSGASPTAPGTSPAHAPGAVTPPTRRPDHPVPEDRR
ncbi:MAG TPA: hypothetical protein VD963_01435 [Phycisphaerales bacterium]|nr:hypothetical protein [Phycisphaerales bacterium]